MTLIERLRGWAKSPNVNPIPLFREAADAIEKAERLLDDVQEHLMSLAEPEGPEESTDALFDRIVAFRGPQNARSGDRG